MTDNRCDSQCRTIDRRTLLTRSVPACAMACLGLSRVDAFGSLLTGSQTPPQKAHKFDVPSNVSLTPRQMMMMRSYGLIGLVKTLQGEMTRPELIRVLNRFSADTGRQQGERQAEASPDRTFKTFVAVFRPPRLSELLTHEVVVDTDKVFQLSVKECLWPETIRGAGLDGEIGHALVCNMDYYWPPAFNPDFKMERSKTLMQGQDECNHRYLNTA